VVAAAQALGTVGGEEGANVLGKAINQSDDYGCQAIVNVLAKLKNPTTASAIIPLLSQTQIRPKCGPAAAYALGEIGNTEAIKPLVANLDIMESRVQPFAIKALGQLKAKNAVNQIIPFLDHKQASHRLAAIEALTYIGDPQTTPYIQKRLTDPSVPVQKAAKYALKHLEKPKK
jgi:HEAT repeat protein